MMRRLLLDELFATRPGAFFALDVLVGVSCGLPLFLYLREPAADSGRAGVLEGGASNG
jgi:hypothetical protein